MFFPPGNRHPKKSEGLKLPSWLTPSTSKVEFGQMALFQPQLKAAEKSKIPNSSKNFNEINYFEALEIKSQAGPSAKKDKVLKSASPFQFGEDLKALSKDVYDLKKSKHSDVYEKVEFLEEENLEMVKEVDALKAEIEKLQISLNMQKIYGDNVFKELESARSILSSNQSQLDSLKDSLTKFEVFEGQYLLQQDEFKNKIKQKVENLQTEKAACQFTNQLLESGNLEMKSKIKSLETKNQEMKSKIGGLEAENQGMQSAIGGLETENQELKSIIGSLEAENQETKSKVEGLEAENQEMKSKVEGLEAKNQEVKLKIETTSKSPVKSILKSPGKNELKATSVELNPISPRAKRKLILPNDPTGSKTVRFNEAKLVRYGKSESQSSTKGVDMSFVKKSISGEPKRVLAATNTNQDKKSGSVFDNILDDIDLFI